MVKKFLIIISALLIIGVVTAIAIFNFRLNIDSKLKVYDEETYIYMHLNTGKLLTYVNQVDEEGNIINKYKVLDYLTETIIKQDMYDRSKAIIALDNDFALEIKYGQKWFDKILYYNFQNNEFEIKSIKDNLDSGDYINSISYNNNGQELVHIINENNADLGYILNTTTNEKFTLDLTKFEVSNVHIGYENIFLENREYIYFAVGMDNLFYLDKGKNEVFQITKDDSILLNQFMFMYEEQPIIAGTAEAKLYTLDEEQNLELYLDLNCTNSVLYGWFVLDESELLLFLRDRQGENNNTKIYRLNLAENSLTKVNEDYIKSENIYFMLYKAEEEYFLQEYDLDTQDTNIIVIDVNTNDIVKKINLGNQGTYGIYNKPLLFLEAKN